MFKHILSAILLASAATAVAADDAMALLRKADKLRAPNPDMQVETDVRIFDAAGKLQKERQYTVFTQRERRSLVLMNSPAEKGQKVLMSGDEFWLFIPSSQRPVRITPMQKLLGEASTGDIATMSWSDDYDAKIVGVEACETTPCTRLSLTATRKGVTYKQIELWIGQQHAEPIKADLYLQSKKLAKQALFVLDNPRAPTAVKEMILFDKVSAGEKTHIVYVERKQRAVPGTWFNPMFLSRNPSLQ